MRTWQHAWALGQGEVPPAPSWFQLPTTESYVAGLGGAFRDIDPNWAREHLSPPVAATVPLMKTVIQTAGNMDFDAMAGGQGTAQQIHAIVSAISDLVQGGLEIAGQLGAAAGAIGGAAEAVPVLGAAIEAIVGKIVIGIQSEALQAAAQQEAEQILHEELKAKCGAQIQADRPYGTDVGAGVSATDFFRRVAYAYQAWQRTDKRQPGKLPLDGASMYVMLCGGETQGFGIPRPQYQEIVRAAKGANRKIGDGIPASVQRRMWKIIQGILGGVTDPVAAPIGDDGRALMPMLQDVVREYYLRVLQKDGPGWDVGLAQRLSDVVTSTYQESATSYIKDDLGHRIGAGTVYRNSSCAGGKYGMPRYVDLSQPLLDSVIKYGAALTDAFWDPAAGAWRIKPKMKAAEIPSGRITLTPKGVRAATDGILDAIGAKVEEHLVLKMGLSLAAGVGAYHGVRHYRLGR